MQIKIYTLTDPATKQVRYIGRTKNTLQLRIAAHIYEARTLNSGTYKDNWLNKLRRNGLKPIIEEVELLNCSWKESHEIEKWYMSLFRSWGFNLTNTCERISTYKKDCSKAIEGSKKRVYQYNLEGYLIGEFTSAREANSITKVSYRMISACCNNKGRNSTGGYMWKFHKLDKIDKYIPQQQHGRKKKEC